MMHGFDESLRISFLWMVLYAFSASILVVNHFEILYDGHHLADSSYFVDLSTTESFLEARRWQSNIKFVVFHCIDRSRFAWESNVLVTIFHLPSHVWRLSRLRLQRVKLFQEFPPQTFFQTTVWDAGWMVLVIDFNLILNLHVTTSKPCAFCLTRWSRGEQVEIWGEKHILQGTKRILTMEGDMLVPRRINHHHRTTSWIY